VPALAAAGFTADHEPIDPDDVRARLRAGLHVMLRNSSLRPDLHRFVELCQDARLTAQLSLTTDGAGPAWLVRHGGIDAMVRTLVAARVPLPRAVRYASLNPATYLHLDEHLGSVTPGRCADLQILPDFAGSPPDVVLVDGQVRARAGALVDPWPRVDWTRYSAALRVDPAVSADPASYAPRATPGETVPVMHLASAGIARRDEAVVDADGWVPDALHAVLFSADGRFRSSGWLRGFARDLDGLATTYTTSMGLLVLGRNPKAMARAAASALPAGAGRGGIAIVEGDEVTARLDLDIAYTMSSRPVARVAREWQSVDAAVRRAGYGFEELLYCLCFITCDFLPDLRLVPSGLLDVKPYRIITPADRICD
ncbi:MAG: adenine deaminase C-terminal domain-containing protein, partial [Streptosporangiales bacterium]